MCVVSVVLRNGEREHCGRRGLKNVRVSSANDYEEAMSPGYRRTVAHKSQWLWHHAQDWFMLKSDQIMIRGTWREVTPQIRSW